VLDLKRPIREATKIARRRNTGNIFRKQHLFDHLVGLSEEIGRDFDAERLGGL
jgi:hypothetical protein